SRPQRAVTGRSSPSPATASATRCTSRASRCPARRCSAPTATRRSAAPPACWRSARVASTSPSRWVAAPTPSRCPRSCACGSPAADDDAQYDDRFELDLAAVTPLVALPGSPDRVVPVAEVEGTKVEQVMVGSCTNGSWEDMWAVTQVLQGRHVHPDVSFVLFPGSHRILETMAREGLLADLLASGALISEPTCGSCAGIGHVPAAGTKSLRAFNRNFPGRSGVKGDEIYLCSSVTAAASALT